MKLIALLSIEEMRTELTKMLIQHQVSVYSELDMRGYKTDRGDTGWFGHENLIAAFSTMYLVFTEEAKADEIMKAVAEFNQNHPKENPVHAFQLAVEKFV